MVRSDFTGEWNWYSHSGLVGDNDQLTLPTPDLIANAEPLFASGSAQGHISGIEPYQSYHFEGQTGELISASVRRISGSLDTVLALIDANGNPLAFNDDTADGTTNSAISSIRLPRDGTYVIVVSHYGQVLGATEGDFVLSVS